MNESNGDKSIVEMLTEMAEQQRAAYARLQTVEEKHQYIDDRLAEMSHWQMRHAAQVEREMAEMRRRSEKEMSEIRASQDRTDKQIQHLMGLFRFFGDKTNEVDGKLRRAGEVFAEGQAIIR